MRRKYISWRTKCAAALAALNYLRRPGLNYTDVKRKTEKQFLSLWHFDHGILHETEHEDRDKFWNLTPMLVADHLEKTKQDAAIIAKSRRLRAKEARHIERLLAKIAAVDPPLPYRPRLERPKRKLLSRGFDKRYKRKLDGTVVKR